MGSFCIQNPGQNLEIPDRFTSLEGAQNRINQSSEKTTRDAVVRYVSAGENSGVSDHHLINAAYQR
jgi:hypothetical protein